VQIVLIRYLKVVDKLRNDYIVVKALCYKPEGRGFDSQ
jgi:hypothetical protein